MHKLYFWKTTIGLIFIAEHEGRFFVIFDDEILGRNYETLKQAAYAAARGDCDPAGAGITQQSRIKATTICLESV
jgi:hypothetical protein